MPSLLFERDTELIVSELQKNGTVSIIHRNHAEDATNIHEETVLTMDEVNSLWRWLDKQISAYSELKLAEMDKNNRGG
jgi:hypothetical protein